jgi:threonine dehydrogenase-like Zn-dependent dehydrogenase
VLRVESGLTALAAARPEGTVVVVGGRRAGPDPPTILLKELRVQGSFMYADEFAEVIALLTDRVLSESPI